MGVDKKFFKQKSGAQRARRKGERVVAYKGGYQLSRVKKRKEEEDPFSIY